MVVLSDLTQRPQRAHVPGSRAYVHREPEAEICPGTLLPVHKAVEAYLALPDSWPPPAPDHAPRASYLPQHQPQALTTHAIVERSSDLALARVRGSAAWVANEARKFAEDRGFTAAELKIVVGH